MSKRIYIHGDRTNIELRNEDPVVYSGYRQDHTVSNWIFLIAVFFADMYLGWPFAGWCWFIIKLIAFVFTGGMFWSSLDAFGI